MPKRVSAKHRRLTRIRQRAQLLEHLSQTGTQEGLSRLPTEDELAEAKERLAAAGAMWVFQHRGLHRSSW